MNKRQQYPRSLLPNLPMINQMMMHHVTCFTQYDRTLRKHPGNHKIHKFQQKTTVLVTSVLGNTTVKFAESPFQAVTMFNKASLAFPTIL